MEATQKRTRWKHILVCMLAGIMMLLGTYGTASAATVNVSFSSEYYVYDSGGHRHNLNRIFIDGTRAFCIEPGVSLNSGTYTDYATVSLDSLVGSRFNAEQLAKAKLTAAMGAEEGGVDNATYFATQVAIWRILGLNISSYNDPIIESHVNTIERKVKIMETPVSFNNETITFEGYGEEYAVTLTDSNDVFQHYKASGSTDSKVHVEQNGSSLKVWLEEGAAKNGTLQYACIFNTTGTGGQLAAYVCTGRQMLATFTDNVQNYVNVNYRVSNGTAKVQKFDAETGSNSQGFASLNKAKYEVIRQDTNEKVGEITWNNGTSSSLSDLPLKDASGNWIEYLVREIEGPSGYHVGEWNGNKLKNETTFNFQNGLDVTVNFKDSVTKVEFSKVEITGGPELPGATLEVLDENGNVLESWVSEDTPHTILGLEVGKQYTLRETIPAPGHYSATEIQFTVNSDNEIQHVEMVDKPTEVYVTKTDITGSKELPGAVIAIKDKETGEVIDKWTSGLEAHVIKGVLDVEKTYILEEITAPKGYKIAESIEFSIMDNGEPVYITIKDELIEVKTGDDFNLMVPLIALMILAAGTAGTIFYRRRKTNA